MPVNDLDRHAPPSGSTDAAAVDLTTVSVVIPTFHRAHLLEEVVSPYLTDGCVSEVIIVDDGPDEPTAAVCAQLVGRSEKVIVLRQHHKGAAAARTAGAVTATGSVLLFIDDDVVAAEGTAHRHLSYHARSLQPLVVVGYMPCAIPRPRRPGQFPIYLYQRYYEGVCRKYEADPTSVLTYLWGGHFSVQRRSFSATTPVPPNFPRHQDRLLGWYLQADGCAGVFDRTLLSEHRFERSSAQFFSDCRKSGQSQVALAAVSRSLPVALPDHETVEQSGGLILESVLRFGAVLGVLRMGICLAGHLHLWGVETLFARVVALGETFRGIHSRTK